MKKTLCFAAAFFLAAGLLAADDAQPRRFPLTLKPGDVIPTGNEWIALPTIRASDGALENFNVLSMSERGLLQVSGDKDVPALQPYFMADGKRLAFKNPSWELIEYWIPTARLTVDGLEASLTYCAPNGSRTAFIHMTLTNRRTKPAAVALGISASWGSMTRVTYVPAVQRGERSVASSSSAWVESGKVFSFITHDTRFAWSLLYPGSEEQTAVSTKSTSPNADARRSAKLAPGETLSADFILGAGPEEFSASFAAEVFRQLLDREGADGVIRRTAAWCRARTRSTGQADLDMLMNRNYLFTALYAWGRTIDTEQLVGMTSRSPRYYVSAAYWDRDAMLWSFPALLDIDKALAKEALNYALTIQLRNTGTHSRFIDGVVLEDGFQLDEAVAPLLALAEYVRRTGDEEFLLSHRAALTVLRDRLLSRFDPGMGLYSTLQDSQDEYRKQAFLTYDNVLSWKALLELSGLYERLKDMSGAGDMKRRAEELRAAILKKEVFEGAPGTKGPVFACGTDGKEPLFDDVPPGSLMLLPALGFVPENDPIFVRTYDWLHSKDFKYSYSDRPYGLPGSYRVPFTTSWSIADHLGLERGRKQALKVLRASNWDGGIISEGVDPVTGVMDSAGRAFATAAGYVAHAICANFCEGGAQGGVTQGAPAGKKE